MIAPAIRFERVSKRYRLGQSRVSLPALVSDWLRRARGGAPGVDTLDALCDVSFDIARGDSVALVGANGAGKTTLLKLLARITHPTSGTVSVQGRLSALIELGAGFHGDLSGRDNIFLNGALLGVGRRELTRRFDEIVDFSGIERFLDTPVKRYSSGMIVRLGFAIAASIEPDVLLVDEVLAVGDAAFSQKCLARIRRLQKVGTTLVFVSHNPYLVKACCRRALYLKQGQLVLSGPAEDVVRAYDRDATRHDLAEPVRAPAMDSGAPVGVASVDVVVGGIVNPRDPVPNDVEAEIRVAYVASTDIGRVQAAVFVRRADGLICCTARSHVAGASLSIRCGGGVIKVKLARLQLIGGAYSVEAYLLDPTDVIVLTPAGARSPWFTVAGQGLAATADAGVFEPVVTWSQQNAAPQPLAAIV